MKRRAFLRMAAVAPAVAPAMAREAASTMLGELAVGSALGGPQPSLSYPQQVGYAEFAQREMRKFLARSAAQKEYEKRRLDVTGLDADVACLRSVSVGQKVRMQREINFQRLEEQQMAHWLGAVAGWFD